MKEGYNGKYGSQSSSCSVPSSPWDLGSVRCHGKGMVFAWIGGSCCPDRPSPDSACTFFPTVYLSRVLTKLSIAQRQVVTALLCVYVATSLLTNG